MAKQIIWSPLAKEALKTLLTTASDGHSLFQLIENALHRVTLNPFIGQPTEAEYIRYVTPSPGCTLFYRHSLLKIEVLVLW